MSYTFLQIVTAIKEEGRVNTSTDLDAMIKRVINESIAKYTRNKTFGELHVDNEALSITSDAQSLFTFPVDAQKITAILFSLDDTYYSPLKERNQFPVYRSSGYPTWYYRSGASINISPTSELLTTHFLKVSYFKKHPLLVNDGDLLLVDDLYPIILNETLGRLRRYHDDFSGAEQYKKDSIEATQLIQQ